MSFYTKAQIFSPQLRGLFRVRCEGGENMPAEGRLILCSNHRSNVDPVLLGASLGRPLFFMAKASLFKIPLFNKLIVTLGAFPVRRGAGDREAIRRAESIVTEGRVLAMFPEGHRLRKGGEPLRFQSGAARIAVRTGAKILPAAIICKGRVWPHKRKLIRVGKPLTVEELGYTDGSSENLRQMSENLRLIVSGLLKGKP